MNLNNHLFWYFLKVQDDVTADCLQFKAGLEELDSIIIVTLAVSTDIRLISTSAWFDKTTWGQWLNKLFAYLSGCSCSCSCRYSRAAAGLSEAWQLIQKLQLHVMMIWASGICVAGRRSCHGHVCVMLVQAGRNSTEDIIHQNRSCDRAIIKSDDEITALLV